MILDKTVRQSHLLLRKFSMPLKYETLERLQLHNVNYNHNSLIVQVSFSIMY